MVQREVLSCKFAIGPSDTCGRTYDYDRNKHLPSLPWEQYLPLICLLAQLEAVFMILEEPFWSHTRPCFRDQRLESLILAIIPTSTALSPQASMGGLLASTCLSYT